jgi:phospholipid/cholesterol/gamma-HCH transport system permease protein
MLYRIGYGAIVFQECVHLYARILLGRERLDLPRFTRDSYDLGLTILPSVTIIALAVGLILGVQAHDLLQQAHLPDMVVSLVGKAVVLEFSPLLIGILVASRAGISLAVRIATMVSRREIEGLILSGVNPVHFTVGTTLLSVLVTSFALGVWSQLLVLAGTGIWLAGSDAIPAPLFLDSLSRAITPGDLWLSVGKTLLFSLLVTLIAAIEGGSVERRPEGISRAATRTMLQGIGVILVADLIIGVLR